MSETALAYGDSDSGKTTLCCYLAKWIYETYGLTTRLVSCDLGGWEPVEKEGLIKAGIVSAFNISSRTNLLADVRKVSRGYWPKIIEEIRQVEQPDGSLVEKKVKVRVLVEDKAALSRVGLYFIEGASSISSAFMAHITKTDQKIGPEDVAGKYEEDGEQFGSNSRGHYNVVQTEMYSLFSAFSTLPVKLVFWTGHVGSGKENGNPVRAPQLAGEAKNADVPSWVGDCFHLDSLPEIVGEDGEVTQNKQVRAYFVRHRDDMGNEYLAKSRMGPSDLGALKERYPNGFIDLTTEQDEGHNFTGGLDQYYRWIEGRKEGNLKGLMGWKERIDAARSK